MTPEESCEATAQERGAVQEKDTRKGSKQDANMKEMSCQVLASVQGKWGHGVQIAIPRGGEVRSGK